MKVNGETCATGEGVRGRGGRVWTAVSAEIRTMVWKRVQPNLSRYAVASIIRPFRNESWLTPVVHTRTGGHCWEHGSGCKHQTGLQGAIWVKEQCEHCIINNMCHHVEVCFRVLQLDPTASKPPWYPCFVLSTSVFWVQCLLLLEICRVVCLWCLCSGVLSENVSMSKEKLRTEVCLHSRLNLRF